MKYPLILTFLLTLSLNAFAGWNGPSTPTPTPPSGGGDSEASSSSYSTSGLIASGNSSSDSTSEVYKSGNSASFSGGGDAKAKVGDVTTEGGSSENSYYSEATEAVSASAASISAMGCQVAMTAQTTAGGFGSITDSPLCNALKLVQVHTIAYINTPAGKDKAAHLVAIHKYQDMADSYVDDTYTTGKVAEIAGQVGQTFSWLALIVWLI